MAAEPTDTAPKVGLFSLPSELLHHICTYLSPVDLSFASRVCHLFNTHASQESLWQTFVQENVPQVHLTSPKPASSFKELYLAHHPYWFLCKHKLWFADTPHTGKLILARYNPHRGSIEAYRVLAERCELAFEQWQWNPSIIIHNFQPNVHLHFEEADVNIDFGTSPDNRFGGENRLQQELYMHTSRSAEGLYSTLALTRPLPAHLDTPNAAAWPPRNLPSRHRVRNESQDGFRSIGHKPDTLEVMSDQAFRIRKWMQFSRQPEWSDRGLHERIFTYTTIPEVAYTPTRERPFRGIWVGDYSGHGCEFIIVLQPDEKDPLTCPVSKPVLPAYDDSITDAANMRDDTPEDFSNYYGPLQAVKLTGDPNVPRGETTFYAEDISSSGLIRIAQEHPFRGARVVRSWGHIAAHDFREDKFIQAQLIMISHDRLAQYWEEFGHVNYYQRVDLNDLLNTYK